jgi:hypothetical protein
MPALAAVDDIPGEFNVKLCVFIAAALKTCGVKVSTPVVPGITQYWLAEVNCGIVGATRFSTLKYIGAPKKFAGALDHMALYELPPKNITS